MVAPIDHEQPAASAHRLHEGRQLSWSAEGITRPLDEERRYRDLGQVRRSQAVRSPRRMKRIPEKDETADLPQLASSGHLSRDPPAHRLASSEETPPLRFRAGPHSGHDGLPRSFEDVAAVGRAPLGVGVEKVERDHRDSAFHDRVGHGYQPRMPLRCPGAGSENQYCLCIRGRVADRRGLDSSDIDLERRGGCAHVSQTTVTPSPPRSGSSPRNRTT